MKARAILIPVVEHPILDAHEIVPNLWQGAAPEAFQCKKPFDFDTVLSCVPLPPEFQCGRDTEIIYLPFDDDDDERDPDWESVWNDIQKKAKVLAQRVQEGENVIVFCRAGLNRSGVVVGSTLHYIYKWAGARCINHIRERRPTNPSPLFNPKFTKSLLRLW